MTKDNPTTRYILRIRNLSKRMYGLRYFKYLLDGKGNEPERGDNLSYMGAQAVRNRIIELSGIKPPEKC